MLWPTHPSPTNADRSNVDTPASTCKLWLRISRPRFWMYVFGPFLVGSIIGARTPQDLLDWRVLLFALYFLFSANFFIYGINDLHDGDTDALNPKKTGYEDVVPPISHRPLTRAIWLFQLPFWGAALATTNMRAWLILLAFVFCSYFYSAPPIRAKARPLLDSIFNVLYICPAWFAYSLLGGTNVIWPYILAAWCWAMAMHAYSAVPDISADRAAGLNTIATWLGLRGTLVGCWSLYLVAAILSYPALTWLSLFLGLIYSVMMGLSLRAGSEDGVLRIYKFFPLLNTVAGFLLFWRIAWMKFF